jgi:hypothetical protein
LIPVGDHILQEFKTLNLTRFRTYKIAKPPQTITQEGRGPQTDKYLPQSPFQVNFLDDDILYCFLSVLSFYVRESSFTIILLDIFGIT